MHMARLKQLPSALSLVDHAYTLKRHGTDNFQTLRAEFVDSVVGGVVEDVVVAVIKINQICRRHATLHKGHVVVSHAHCPGKKMRLIAKLCGGSKDYVFEPWRRIRIMLDVQVGVANHVFKN